MKTASKNLSRTEIAKKAAAKRWDKSIPVASHQGILIIGDKNISCLVTESGERILRVAHVFATFGRPPRGSRKLGKNLGRPPFMDAANLEPFINQRMNNLLKPIEYRDFNGRLAIGYKAEILPQICLTYLKAESAKALITGQRKMVETSHLILGALSTVGIIALVDEATGYQQDRTKNALAQILEAFISDELREWVKTFPSNYYKELFRLKGLEYSQESVKRPRMFANMTNNIVYQRLAPGLLQELKRISDRTEKGNLKHKYHQKLSANTGYIKLKEHLASVVSIMKLSKDYKDFKTKLDLLHPKRAIGDLYDNESDDD